MLWLTKSGIEHIERHLITLLSARDCDQSLIAVILWFIDLDHTPAQLPNLVDLLSTLTDDGANHVVWYEDLLCQRLPRKHSLHGLRRSASMALLGYMATVVWLVWTSPNIPLLRRPAVVKWCLSLLLRWLTMKIRNSIWIGWGTLGLIVVAFVIVWMAILTTGRLRHVRHDLHTTRYYASWTTTSGGISRSRWAAESFR